MVNQLSPNAGETIWHVAKRHHEHIPHLCYTPEPGYRADGNCRACMVEIDGERRAGSFLHAPANLLAWSLKVHSRNGL